MKIRNDGKATIVFNGGQLEPKTVAVFKGEAEKIGAVLLSRYHFLTDLDNLKEEEVKIVEVTSEPEPEKVEEEKVEPAKAKSKKPAGKKSNK